MWKEERVTASELADIEALEKKLGGRVMNVRVEEDGEAIVEYAPVVDTSWFVEVWDNTATICFINQFDFILDVKEIYEVDEDAFRQVVEHVLSDYGVDLGQPGQYYPITQAAQDAYEAMMKTAKRKRGTSRSYG